MSFTGRSGDIAWSCTGRSRAVLLPPSSATGGASRRNLLLAGRRLAAMPLRFATRADRREPSSFDGSSRARSASDEVLPDWHHAARAPPSRVAARPGGVFSPRGERLLLSRSPSARSDSDEGACRTGHRFRTGIGHGQEHRTGTSGEPADGDVCPTSKLGAPPSLPVSPVADFGMQRNGGLRNGAEWRGGKLASPGRSSASTGGAGGTVPTLDPTKEGKRGVCDAWGSGPASGKEPPPA